jgi:hypothetical protein
LFIIILICYEVLDIGLDLVKGYALKITNRINYLSCFRSEQVLIKKNINIYRYKKGIKLVFVFIIKIWGLNYNISLLYNNSLYYC